MKFVLFIFRNNLDFFADTSCEFIYWKYEMNFRNKGNWLRWGVVFIKYLLVYIIYYSIYYLFLIFAFFWVEFV